MEVEEVAVHLDHLGLLEGVEVEVVVEVVGGVVVADGRLAHPAHLAEAVVEAEVEEVVDGHPAHLVEAVVENPGGGKGQGSTP